MAGFLLFDTTLDPHYLRQERGYAAKYHGRGEAICLIGVEFSRETRNVAAFEVEQV